MATVTMERARGFRVAGAFLIVFGLWFGWDALNLPEA
jgi:hypothetical protein